MEFPEPFDSKDRRGRNGKLSVYRDSTEKLVSKKAEEHRRVRVFSLFSSAKSSSHRSVSLSSDPHSGLGKPSPALDLSLSLSLSPLPNSPFLPAVSSFQPLRLAPSTESALHAL